MKAMNAAQDRRRNSTENQSAAVARAALLYPEREQVLQARDRVLASPVFQPSKRACDLFRYVVGCALTGRADELKERVIGHQVFGREPGYDTGSDAVVRVVANDVRKRLQAYREQNPQDPVVFELPVGSYVLLTLLKKILDNLRFRII